MEGTDEYVVFITPTKLQLSMFSAILNADKLDNLMQGSTAESLALITTLTKISNSPILLKAAADQNKIKMQSGVEVVKRAGVDEALNLLPDKVQIEDFSLSGMLISLPLLHWFWPFTFREIERPCQPIEGYSSGISHWSCGRSHLIDDVLEHGRKMHHCITLHVNSQYPRSILQKEIIHLFPPGWVSHWILHPFLYW